jgi:hypothetical protein
VIVGSRTAPLGIVAAVVAIGGLIAVALALALPLEERVTFSGGASINDREDVVVDVDCGTPLRGGPPMVASGGQFREDPCGDAVGGRRVLAAGAGVVALVAIWALSVIRRRSASPGTDPAP